MNLCELSRLVILRGTESIEFLELLVQSLSGELLVFARILSARSSAAWPISPVPRVPAMELTGERLDSG